jgi:hypothetical protein
MTTIITGRVEATTLSQGKTKRVITSGQVAGSLGTDTWGGTWGGWAGGSKANSWGLTWSTSLPPTSETPSQSSTKRVTDTIDPIA